MEVGLRQSRATVLAPHPFYHLFRSKADHPPQTEMQSHLSSLVFSAAACTPHPNTTTSTQLRLEWSLWTLLRLVTWEK